MTVGLLLMGNLSDSSGWTALLPGQILAGIGIGLATPALASTAVGVVPPQLSGMASGASDTARQLGLATGIAGLGSIFQSKSSPRSPHSSRARPRRRTSTSSRGLRRRAGPGARCRRCRPPPKTKWPTLRTTRS